MSHPNLPLRTLFCRTYGPHRLFPARLPPCSCRKGTFGKRGSFYACHWGTAEDKKEGGREEWRTKRKKERGEKGGWYGRNYNMTVQCWPDASQESYISSYGMMHKVSTDWNNNNLKNNNNKKKSKMNTDHHDPHTHTAKINTTRMRECKAGEMEKAVRK